jgi:hypothetical protein
MTCVLLTGFFYSLPSEKFRFSKERQALDLFVNRIASHPELKQSEVLRVFLQADEEVKYFNMQQKNATLFLVTVML